MTTALRAPDGRFAGLAGYPFAPKYVEFQTRTAACCACTMWMTVPKAGK